MERLFVYRITGKYFFLEDCDCFHCEGHEESSHVNEFVEAHNEDEAKAKVLELVEKYHRKGYSFSWTNWDGTKDGCKIQLIREIPYEVQLRRAGYAPLPLVG